MTIQESPEVVRAWIFQFIRSIPGFLVGLATIGAALWWVFGFANKIVDGIETLDRTAVAVTSLTVDVEAIRRRVDEFEAVRAQERVPPIRFAEFGHKVEPVEAGGVAVVTWQFWVEREDCPAPQITLHMIDALDIARRVEMVDFRPAKLQKRPQPYLFTYTISPSKHAATGRGSLWVEAVYMCPGNINIPVRSPDIAITILPPANDPAVDAWKGTVE